MPRLEVDEFTVQVVRRRLAASHEDDLAIPADLHPSQRDAQISGIPSASDRLARS